MRLLFIFSLFISSALALTNSDDGNVGLLSCNYLLMHSCTHTHIVIFFSLTSWALWLTQLRPLKLCTAVLVRPAPWHLGSPTMEIHAANHGRESYARARMSHKCKPSQSSIQLQPIHFTWSSTLHMQISRKTESRPDYFFFPVQQSSWAWSYWCTQLQSREAYISSCYVSLRKTVFLRK